MDDHIQNMIKIKLSLERDIQYFNDTLTQTKENLAAITAFIREYCKHEWVHDYIDLDVTRGENITYCKICELSPT